MQVIKNMLSGFLLSVMVVGSALVCWWLYQYSNVPKFKPSIDETMTELWVWLPLLLTTWVYLTMMINSKTKAYNSKMLDLKDISYFDNVSLVTSKGDKYTYVANCYGYIVIPVNFFTLKDDLDSLYHDGVVIVDTVKLNDKLFYVISVTKGMNQNQATKIKSLIRQSVDAELDHLTKLVTNLNTSEKKLYLTTILMLIKNRMVGDNIQIFSDDPSVFSNYI